MDRPKPIPTTGIEAPDGRKFPWGPIQKIHEVGEYQIVEYLNDASKYSEGSWPHHGKTYFHPYLNRRNTSNSYDTLDEALVGVIAYKRGGPNSRAAGYFELMTRGELPA